MLEDIDAVELALSCSTVESASSSSRVAFQNVIISQPHTKESRTVNLPAQAGSNDRLSASLLLLVAPPLLEPPLLELEPPLLELEPPFLEPQLLEPQLPEPQLPEPQLLEPLVASPALPGSPPPCRHLAHPLSL